MMMWIGRTNGSGRLKTEGVGKRNADEGYILTPLSSINCCTFFCAASLMAGCDEEKNLRKMNDMKPYGLLASGGRIQEP